MKKHCTDPSEGHSIRQLAIIFKHVKVIKIKEWLKNCLKFKVTAETWKLNATADSETELFGQKGHYWKTCNRLWVLDGSNTTVYCQIWWLLRSSSIYPFLYKYVLKVFWVVLSGQQHTLKWFKKFVLYLQLSGKFENISK